MDPSSSIVSLRPARTLRLRAPTTRTHNVGTSSTAASDPSTGRPTVLELERAERMRERLKAAQIIGDRGQPAKLKVIACAIAMSVKDATFKDDREAKGLFGVAKDTKIRRDWIDGGSIKGSWVEAKFKRLAAYEREVRRKRTAARITDVERRAQAAAARVAAFHQKQQEKAKRKRVRFRAQHLTIPEGACQCEGFTRATGLQCMVHSHCTFADAAPLRTGAAYCRHHDPAKFTGVQCGGFAKKTRCRCRIFSGSQYPQARPLKPPVNSPWCHFHRLRCRGVTLAGKRCCVTSSSLNTHAGPLRAGEQYCAHHATQALSPAPASAAPAQAEEAELRRLESGATQAPASASASAAGERRLESGATQAPASSASAAPAAALARGRSAPAPAPAAATTANQSLNKAWNVCRAAALPDLETPAGRRLLARWAVRRLFKRWAKATVKAAWRCEECEGGQSCDQCSEITCECRGRYGDDGDWYCDV